MNGKEVEAAAVSWSLTVRVIVYVTTIAKYVWEGSESWLVPPSPKSQR